MFRKWLKHINKQFDTIQEPKRFFAMIALAMPGIIMSNANDIVPAFIGMAYLIILILVRYLYIVGKL